MALSAYYMFNADYNVHQDTTLTGRFQPNANDRLGGKEKKSDLWPMKPSSGFVWILSSVYPPVSKRVSCQVE
jgi:hypothetical protein